MAITSPMTAAEVSPVTCDAAPVKTRAVGTAEGAEGLLAAGEVTAGKIVVGADTVGLGQLGLPGQTMRVEVTLLLGATGTLKPALGVG